MGLCVWGGKRGGPPNNFPWSGGAINISKFRPPNTINLGAKTLYIMWDSIDREKYSEK